mmetsp:Transcript_35556/g.110117  ORF Transcript_35556/g.110117 Transcript_35556/m.110117 type:complete len:503 (+) Transcript_35556:141-1649(+)
MSLLSSRNAALVIVLAASAHALTPSKGCDAASPPGDKTVSRKFDGTRYKHDVYADKTDDPKPLLLYFHGLGGSRRSGGPQAATKRAARDHGFVAVAMQGIGEKSSNSWHAPLAGTSSSRGPEGPTCAPNTPAFCGGYDSCKESSNGNDDACLQDAWDEWPGEWRCDRSTDYCEGKWADDMAKCCPDACDGCRGDLKCAWTTCKDSVAQTIDVYQYVVDRYCVDLDAVWATGSSNGGVFAHELAYDTRSSKLLAGIVPQIGLPHSGFNRAPATPMFYFGTWGRFDKSMPPRGVGENAVAGRPDAVFDTDYNGWYYTNAKTITDKWAQTMQCGDAANYDIAISGETWTCDQYPGCATGHSVVGCIFEGGHDDLSRNAFDVIFEWIKARSNEPSSDVNSGGNDDACLQDAWAEWDGVWRCDESQEYCVGEWADDMAACCPESCDYEPSYEPTKKKCEDDPDWRYNGKANKDCKWIASENTGGRCKNKGDAATACAKTCATCSDDM